MKCLLLAVVAGAALAAPMLPLPCKKLDGTPYSSDLKCKALADDVVLNGTIGAGGVMRYHWVMTDWSMINVPDSVRACHRLVLCVMCAWLALGGGGAGAAAWLAGKRSARPCFLRCVLCEHTHAAVAWDVAPRRPTRGAQQQHGVHVP
jgi:hypothetical protein